MQEEERRKKINLKNTGVNLMCNSFGLVIMSNMVINVTVLDLPLNLVWNKSKGFAIVANFYHNDIYIYFCLVSFLFFNFSAVHQQTYIVLIA